MYLLDEVLVEAVSSTVPATRCILEQASIDIHQRADETWKRLCPALEMARQ